MGRKTNEALQFLLSRVYVADEKPGTTLSESDQQGKGRNIDQFKVLAGDYNKLKRSLTGNQEDLRLTALSQEERSNPVFKSKYQNIISDQLHEIAKYDSGKRLLKEIHRLALRDDKRAIISNGDYKPFKIVLQNNGSNRYNRDENQVELNFSNAIAATQNGITKLFSLYPLIHGRIQSSDGEELVESREGLSPFFISTFHELNHYKDNKSANSKVKAFVYDTQNPNILQQGADRMGDIRRTLWEEISQQEHRVIFDADRDDVSELTLRMEAQEPLRYLYQDSKEGAIYEPIKTVFRYGTHFVPNKNKYQATIGLSNYLYNLPQIQQVHTNINTKYMKLRLANDKRFQNDFETRGLAKSEELQKFIDTRTSLGRVAEAQSSMQKTIDRLTVLKLPIWKNTQWVQKSVASLSPTVRNDENQTRSMLTQSLVLRLNRRDRELKVLQQLNIPQGGRVSDYPNAFRQMIGLKPVRTMPIAKVVPQPKTLNKLPVVRMRRIAGDH